MIISRLSLAWCFAVATHGALLERRDAFSVTWLGAAQDFVIGLNNTISYIVHSEDPTTNLNVILCQTQAASGETVTSQNSWQVVTVLGDICFDGPRSTSCGADGRPVEAAIPVSVGLLGPTTGNLDNYFFCFAKNTATSPVCEGFSNVFDIASSSDAIASLPTASVSFPIIPLGLTVAQSTSNLVLLQSASATISSSPEQTATTSSSSSPLTAETSGTVAPSSTAPGSMVTISLAPTGTTTITTEPTSTGLADSANSSSSKSTSSSHNSGLPVGAIVGIALGALVILILLLLLSLFCLRRAHKKKAKSQSIPPPEQVLLTRDIHADSFSQNVTPTEKTSTSTTASSTQPADMLTHNSLSLPIQHPPVYTSPPSIPYPGVAAAIPTPANVPQRNPTSATLASNVSRGLSAASSNGSRSIPMSPQSDYEEYRDVPAIPIFGDARRSPQIFEGRVPTPFLSEEGMSAEEIARFEEEERRIDLAIAEAEERRNSRAR